MVIDYFKHFNWLDIFIVILLIRICYISLRNGLPVQLFWFLGTIAAVYLSLHYYLNFADFLGKRFPDSWISTEVLALTSFVILAFLGYISFVVLQRLLSRFIRLEANPQLNKYGGLICGVMRGLFITALIIFLFSISSFSYFKNSAKNSFAGRYLFKVAPVTYSWLWHNLMSKFMLFEKFNSAVEDVHN